MEVASGLAGGTLMTVAGQTMLAVAGQSMNDAPSVIIIGVYEKADHIGGYGSSSAASDDTSRCSFPNLLYSFSFYQNYHWKHEYASRAEVAAYMQDTASKFSLAEHIHTSIDVVKANWVDDKNYWCVRLRDLDSGHEYNRYCTVLISAAGGMGWQNDFDNSRSSSDEQMSMSISMMDDYVPLARKLRRTGAKIANERKTEHGVPDANLSHGDIEVIGARDGTTLAQYWKETRGPQAYWGCLVASFPNFGLVAGPYTLPPNGSPFSAIETCVSYLSRNLVAPILDNRATRVEVRQAVEDRWAASLRLANVDGFKEPAWPYSAISFYVRSLLYGSRGLVYKNGQTAWWMNMFVRWAKSIRLRTWLTLLLGVALLRVKSVKSKVDRARADVEKYVPYEKQALELAGKLKETVLK